MDGSSMDESTASDSTSLSPTSPLPFLPATDLSPPESLSRLGSGASVTLDSEITSATAGAGGTVLDQVESRKLPSSKYKGVVPQPNGRWGAQIYEKHQRVWLGTFNEENGAAKAYDIAAQRFRGRDAITNFKPLSVAIQNDDVEMVFLNSHSKSEIVDMLRKHTYNDELQQSKNSYGLLNKNGKRYRSNGNDDVFCSTSERNSKTRELLFEKSVTPSDVGKLNRLVIPKQHAEKHFPLQGKGGANGVSAKGLLLNFEDVREKVWRFRYSYWNSSQSYVLTKGWSRFVKEKNLKAGDVVCFLRSTGPDKQLYIDWKEKNGSGHVVRPVQVVRLFGVNILKAPATSCDAKNPGLDLLGLQCGKKQRIIGAL